MSKKEKITEVLEIWKYNKKTNIATKFIAWIAVENPKILRLEDGYFIQTRYFTNEQIKIICPTKKKQKKKRQ